MQSDKNLKQNLKKMETNNKLFVSAVALDTVNQHVLVNRSGPLPVMVGGMG